MYIALPNLVNCFYSHLLPAANIRAADFLILTKTALKTGRYITAFRVSACFKHLLPEHSLYAVYKIADGFNKLCRAFGNVFMVLHYRLAYNKSRRACYHSGAEPLNKRACL